MDDFGNSLFIYNIPNWTWKMIYFFYGAQSGEPHLLVSDNPY
jgi:hypothetical protein